jgi:S-disulfanyl-L-cysteine oxidoreductase SoxD
MARMTRPRAAVVMLIAACAALSAGPAAAQNGGAADSMRSVLAGVYTAQQAAAGEVVFRETCGNCHPTSQFTGATFQKVWHGRALFAFFDQVRMMMPMDNPGGLSDQQYADVVAYILKLNAYPDGSAPLPAADSALKRIRFETRTGGTQD